MKMTRGVGCIGALPAPAVTRLSEGSREAGPALKRVVRWGVGPFFGLAAKQDVIESFALGLMIGRRDAGTASTGFSLGIGAVLDKGQKTLARGFEEGKPLPAGETAPKFETRSKWSPVLFFTRSF